jgi:hypothetical protein
MRYQPITDKNYFHKRDYVGEWWTIKYIRAVQAVLSATMGKIGRGKSFFQAAFGKDETEFEEILNMPEWLIVHRFEHDSKKRAEYPELERYWANKEVDNVTGLWRAQYQALTADERALLHSIIHHTIHTEKLQNVVCDNAKVKSVLRFYQEQSSIPFVDYDTYSTEDEKFESVPDATSSQDFDEKHLVEDKIIISSR